MASQLSNIFDVVGCLGESARRGDWKCAAELAAILRQQTLPARQDELGEYLRCLKRVLIAAKVSRAQSAASLVRLNAVARFNKIRADPAPLRQEFGETADF